MRKLLKLIIINFTLLLFLHIPSHSIEITKDLKLLDLSKVNEESCRYAGRGALTLNKNFSDFIQGYEEPLAIDGASAFIEDNTAYLNNALAGYSSEKEDGIFKKRLVDLSISNSFKKVDWTEKGGSSPSFVTNILIKSLAYSTSYLRNKNKLNKEEINQLNIYVEDLKKNSYLADARIKNKDAGRYKSISGDDTKYFTIDTKFARATSFIMWGAAINDKKLFVEGYEIYMNLMKTLDKKKFFEKKLRGNNEVIQHVIQGAEVLRLNGFNIYNTKFKNGSLRDQLETHAKRLIKNNNKEIAGLDPDAGKTSIVKTRGYGAHVAWIPFYLNDEKNNTENIQKVHEIATGFSLDDYSGGALAIHSGCLYGKNYIRY